MNKGDWFKQLKNKTKVFAAVSVLLAVGGLLCSCGRSITDDDNKNICIESETNNAPSVDIYYDTSDGMVKYLNDADFSKIIYSAYSAVDDAWVSAKRSIFSVNNTVNSENDSFFSGVYEDIGTYVYTTNGMVSTLNGKINKENLNIIITDLGSQLHNYNQISNFLIENGLAEHKAVAVIGVDSEAGPYYIIVIGENRSVSDYVSAFKKKPDIMNISGSADEEFSLDVVKPINYQILADKSGIMGIKYKDIEFVKGEGNLRKITKTSREGLDDIEGMVNFNPQKEIIKRADPDAVDIGAASLLDKKDIKNKYGGKIKMYIPFDIIDGVHLSTMDCTVTSDLYIENPSKKGSLKLYENDYSDFIETDVAEGVTPEQGKWRVDDKTNSLIFNVTLANAAKLPSGSKAVKLDVTMEHFSSAETLPAWIKSWDESKTSNLINMFAAVYNYQEKSNSAQNSFTLYIGID